MSFPDHGRVNVANETQNAEARHRYSEFESFRQSMAKLYPTLIIPPIPSKNTIGDYAVKQAKAKEDAAMIARRKRMLQTFLNRIARHPILSNEHVFHRFLDGEVSWVSPAIISPSFLQLMGPDGSSQLTTCFAPTQEHPESTLAQSNGSERLSCL